jgi:hypothetical protein
MQTKFLSTAIGSMPYSDPKHAVEVSIRQLDCPIWPQLGAFGLLEQMEIQYSEGVPCVVIDKEKGRMFFDTAGDTSEAMAEFYETYTMAMDPDEGDGDCSALAISEDYSHGLHEMLRYLKAEGKKYPWLKVQTTGPCSVALTITDENKRAIYYNEEFRDIVVKAMAMKCRWQIQQFKPYAENIICFIDEPILSAFGSSTYVSVKRDEVVGMLAEVVDAVHAEGGLAGVHCCGNTEWSILVDAGVDIVNFDAFEYGHTVVMYAEHMKKLHERGGMLAWGIVPTSAKVMDQTCETLEAIMETTMDDLAAKSGLDKKVIAQQALITPSCGAGSLTVPQADKVFLLVDEFSKFMKKKYGF